MDLLSVALKVSSRCPECGEIALYDENDEMVCDSCGWRPKRGEELKRSKREESDLIKIIKKNEENFGLSFVPKVILDVVKAGITVDSAKRLLTEASGRGEIELRPESGMGRLSKEEIDLCVKTDCGILSWIRIV
jgi:hypothetical protein